MSNFLKNTDLSFGLGFDVNVVVVVFLQKTFSGKYNLSYAVHLLIHIPSNAGVRYRKVLPHAA